MMSLKRISAAPPVRMAWEMISLRQNHSLMLVEQVSSRMEVVILAQQIHIHLDPCEMAETSVSYVAPTSQRERVRADVTRTGSAMG